MAACGGDPLVTGGAVTALRVVRTVMTRWLLLALLGTGVVPASTVSAQVADSSAPGDTLTLRRSTITPARSFSWFAFGAGFVASIAAHELGHVVASSLVGGSPSIGFDTGRPVVYSGIDARLHPRRQFAFSASGMAVQLLLNEVILDWPRGPGSAGEFERGILAGGVGTVLFYFTIGRNSSVGDVQWMDDTSGLSKWGLTAIYGGVALTHVVRVAVKERYAHFFAFPSADGTLHVGVTLAP